MNAAACGMMPAPLADPETLAPYTRVATGHRGVSSPLRLYHLWCISPGPFWSRGLGFGEEPKSGQRPKAFALGFGWCRQRLRNSPYPRRQSSGIATALEAEDLIVRTVDGEHLVGT